jgi:hypothetical protein
MALRRSLPLLLLLTLGQALPAAAATRDTEAVVAAVVAFYRDLAVGDPARLTDHFWPSKVVSGGDVPPWLAEAPVPTGGLAWRPPAGAPSVQVEGRGLEAISAEVHGRWARVEVAFRSPAGASPARDHLWLVALDGRWGIVRLVRDQPASSQ